MTKTALKPEKHPTNQLTSYNSDKLVPIEEATN